MRHPFNRAFHAAAWTLQGRHHTNQNGLSQIEITRLALVLPRLGVRFNGYRLVQISDLHIGTWLDRTRLCGVVEMVNKEEPDLVAITGDFVTSTPEIFEKDLYDALSGLTPKDVSVAILGNHDHWTDPELVRRVLHRTHILDLSNHVYTLQRGDEMLHVAGVDDILEELDRLEIVLEQLPEEGAAILLAHEPDFGEKSAHSGRFDLQLSGHTHGGQIDLPLIGPPVLPPLGRKYPRGMYKIREMIQYTNRGIGTAELTLRINCPPEITVFTLLAGNQTPQVEAPRSIADNL